MCTTCGGSGALLSQTGYSASLASVGGGDAPDFTFDFRTLIILLFVAMYFGRKVL